MLIIVWIRGFFSLFVRWRLARVLSNTTIQLLQNRPLIDTDAGIQGQLDSLTIGRGRVKFTGWLVSEKEITRVSLVIGDRVLTHHFAAVYPIVRESSQPSTVAGTDQNVGFAHIDRARVPETGTITIVVDMADGSELKISAGTYAINRTKTMRRGYLWDIANFFGEHVVPELPNLLFAQRRDPAVNRVIAKLDPSQFVSPTEVLNLATLIPVEVSKPSLPAGVDVIVPVFNGMAYLPELFDRLAETLPVECRLIVIEDASTDATVLPLLEATGDRPEFRGRWTLITHAVNRGFIGSVNEAMAMSDRHVALLNTDTRPPDGWVERLMTPIFDDPTIASTTPFSTSAELCSFPRICRDNPLPGNATVDVVDATFARFNPQRRHIDLPTGVGFCMGLSRAFLDQVGEFDEETFGRGYGEENDWCQRALVKGGRSVLVHNLFVEHAHGASFPNSEKDQLLKTNLQKLRRKHPHYFDDVEEFLDFDPIASLRGCALAMLAPHLTDGDIDVIFDHTAGGGANRYRQEKIQELKAAGHPVMLITNEIGNLFHAEVHVDGAIGRFSFAGFNGLHRLFPQQARIRWHCNCVVGYTNVPAVIEFLIRRHETFGDRIEVSLHDFFPVCLSYNLLDYEGRYCGVPAISACDKCLVQNPHAEPIPQSIGPGEWREMWLRLLAVADRIQAYSKNSADIVSRAFASSSLAIEVRPHSTMANPADKVGLLPLATDETINIVVVGSIGYSKGAEVVRRAARLIAKHGLAARIIIVGTIDIKPLRSHLTVTGAYEHGDLPAILRQHNAHIAWVPSIWPETFSFVASELIDMKIPVACFDLGAPAERIRNYQRGLVLNSMGPKRALDDMIVFAREIRRSEQLPN